MLLYVVCSQRMVCGLQSLFVQNVKFSIVFNVTLFWLIQECKGALPEMPPGTGSLCDYGEICEICQVLQPPSPSVCYYAT